MIQNARVVPRPRVILFGIGYLIYVYLTHAVLSLWSLTDYSTMLCKYILQHLPLYYLEYIFLNGLPYCCMLYYIILLLVYPDLCPSFFTHLLAYHKPGEGRVLSRTHIWDLYLWLRSKTYELLDWWIKLNNRVLIFLSYISILDIYI